MSAEAPEVTSTCTAPLRIPSCTERQLCDAVDSDGDVSGSAQGGIRPVGRGILEQARVLQPAGELEQRDLRLLACESGAEAVVDSGEEAEVLVVLPLRLEP